MKNYFQWLQKDAPAGQVEPYPQLNENGESSQPGVFIIGDLTGVPLLKFAVKSGVDIVDKLLQSGLQAGSNSTDMPEVLIAGAGPAGISCAIECHKRGLKYELVDASAPFNTIVNFPKGKPIIATPKDLQLESPLKIENGTKESLLLELQQSLEKLDLNLEQNCRIESIASQKDHLLLQTSSGPKKAKRVVLAIGKSGHARNLGIPGDHLDKVYNRLFDPSEYQDLDILVVGGGDSAMETALALCPQNNVTLSYRKNQFHRPKPENQQAVDLAVQNHKLQLNMDSHVLEIKEKEIILQNKSGKVTLKNDLVFTMIGRELPLAFFKRSGIRMQGEADTRKWVGMVALMSFFCMLYFGKKGTFIDIHSTLQTGSFLLDYLNAPRLVGFPLGDPETLFYSVCYILGWLGSLIFMVSGLAALILLLKNSSSWRGKPWPIIKYSYFLLVALFFLRVYFKVILGYSGWQESPEYWYAFFYTVTIGLFGWRRSHIKKTRYIRRQTLTLFLIQALFLFLLPFHLYDLVLEPFEGTGWMNQLFPHGRWSSFGFILFWPLNMGDFGSSLFWTIFPFIQTFGFLWYIVHRFGKGAYCGWICSCGGMAETLGDEYRNHSPHGPKAKKLENIGQWILLFALILTLLKSVAGSSASTATLIYVYKFFVDVFFAGALGLGVYFYLGGRIWCRFGCPLAALMHIFTRFSRYRISAEKKKCISCNICTKVCHMGIDVMNFANKGIPMDDVECVRCSSCVHSCPTQVLSFVELEHSDVDNKIRQEVPIHYGKDDWRAGIH